MITVIKKGSSPETVREKYQKYRQKKEKGVLRKYCGTIKLKGDPLKLQKKWRNEWE